MAAETKPCPVCKEPMVPMDCGCGLGIECISWSGHYICPLAPAHARIEADAERIKQLQSSGLELGLIAAAAWLANSHGFDSIAKELLGQHGVTHYGACDDWDRERLEAAGIKLKEGHNAV